MLVALGSVSRLSFDTGQLERDSIPFVNLDRKKQDRPTIVEPLRVKGGRLRILGTTVLIFNRPNAVLSINQPVHVFAQEFK